MVSSVGLVQQPHMTAVPCWSPSVHPATNYICNIRMCAWAASVCAACGRACVRGWWWWIPFCTVLCKVPAWALACVCDVTIPAPRSSPRAPAVHYIL